MASSGKRTCARCGRKLTKKTGYTFSRYTRAYYCTIGDWDKCDRRHKKLTALEDGELAPKPLPLGHAASPRSPSSSAAESEPASLRGSTHAPRGLAAPSPAGASGLAALASVGGRA